jgi:magnesium chelatase family protein
VLAVAQTFTLLGVSAKEVQAEVDVNRGLPAFSIVGLPDAAIKESRERVRAAMVNSGFEFPLRRITASLAPADLRKGGPGLDLAIAAALLVASGQVGGEFLSRFRITGELALDGSIRPVSGVLAMAEEARSRGAEGIVVPARNAAEAALIDGLTVAGLDRLDQLPALSKGELESDPPAGSALVAAIGSNDPDIGDPDLNGGAADGPTRDLALRSPRSSRSPGAAMPDLAELRGQPFLRRALEVAAAGGHNLFVSGPPGAGKSLAARRLPSILPPLGTQEAIEVTRIASACGRGPEPGTLCGRPFRAPHHTISAAGLVGGGVPPGPGEVTHAHRGVLFLDEFGEFSREALEALRQPLEDGSIGLTRGVHAVELPSRFMLVAAANPCPCGHGDGSERCECSLAAIRRYHSRLSGPLADRMDVSISIEQPSAAALAGDGGEPSSSVRDRVIAARERQSARLGIDRSNAEMNAGESRAAGLGSKWRATLAAGYERLGLSGRGYERVLRVARTIADLEGSAEVKTDHLDEALTLRRRSTR